MFKPIYTITNKINSQISQIAEIKALVEKTRLLPKREAFLRRAAVIKMAHSSTSIEGNQLQEYQVKELLEGKAVRAEKDQVLEVKNYLKALNKNDVLAREGNFDTDSVLKIHKLVMEGLVEPQKLGRFRPGSVFVVNILADGREKVVYTPPPASQVAGLLTDLLDWLKKSDGFHPIIRAGLFHYQFESIHPFTDGNGRTGRLLTLLSLYIAGWDFKKVLVLEDYYNRNRKNYYQALQTGKTFEDRGKADLTGWLEYFVEGFLEETLRIKNQILGVVTASENPDSLDLDELKIIDFVLTLGKITSSDVEDILNVPKRTAQFKLKKLEAQKILKKISFGPKTYYIIHPV